MCEAPCPTPLRHRLTPIIFIARGDEMWLLGFETDPGAVVLSSKHAVCVPSFLITSQTQV